MLTPLQLRPRMSARRLDVCLADKRQTTSTGAVARVAHGACRNARRAVGSLGLFERIHHMRRSRKRIAGMMLLGWLFAQFVAIAHACPALNTAAPASNATATASPMPTDCEAMAKLAGSNANICQSHCIAGEQVDTQAQAPAAALSPQPALTIRVADPQLVKSADRHAPGTCGNDPPATLLFGRFLI